METKDMIRELRTKKGLSQDELAEKVYVTRQAVSRWENGETTPNTETLKLLSKLFDVSINTLLGSPRQLICQCCGMPLEDSSISKEPDGFFNEEYCKWCYADGEYMYHDMDDHALVVEKHGGDHSLTLFLLLLFDHGVEAADGVALQSAHGAAAIQNKNQFCHYKNPPLFYETSIAQTKEGLVA